MNAYSVRYVERFPKSLPIVTHFRKINFNTELFDRFFFNIPKYRFK